MSLLAGPVLVLWLLHVAVTVSEVFAPRSACAPADVPTVSSASAATERIGASSRAYLEAFIAAARARAAFAAAAAPGGSGGYPWAVPSGGRSGIQGSDGSVLTGERVAEFIVRDVLATSVDGFTVDPRTLQVPGFEEDEYVVSLAGHERRCAEGGGVPTRRELEDWLVGRLHVLSRPTVFVGGWRDTEGDGSFYLDVSIAVKGRAAALDVARENRQRSVYHPATRACIWVERVAEVRPSGTVR